MATAAHALRRDLARGRRAARRDGQPGRHVDPDRVPRALGSRRRGRLDALARVEGAPRPAARPPCRRAGSSSSAARSAAAGTGSSPSWRARPRRSGRCAALELERYDDLLELDLASAGDQVEHPLLLVCTHGKHDRCCAKFGRPLYDAVREQVDEEWVWQSTHVGGDRFAGNLVVLPDGVYYGRVEPSEAWPLLECALAGSDPPAALPRPLAATRSRFRRPSGRFASRRACAA